ncbi:winged helix-turn-helix transcriptional regulator, partial [bacterium]
EVRFRSKCPVASTLDLLGDKWTLIVVRDLLFGKRKYSELEASFEKIPTNLLADRLRKLERYELISKEPYQTNPVRHEYRLTEKGKDLVPVLRAISRWGEKHIEGRWIVVGDSDSKHNSSAKEKAKKTK